MTPLATQLCRDIKQTGALTLADFMQRALTDPTYGYYMCRQPFGRPSTEGGDFTTAPEMSQMFGEMLGAWCIDLWQRASAPAAFCLLELGPGRGTMMADMLRAARLVPDFKSACEVHFVEMSPPLRALQKQHVPSAIWHNDMSDLPDLPIVFIANEFFDALPVRQFRYSKMGWCEIMVDVADDRLVFSEAASATCVDSLASATPKANIGDIIEICTPAHDYMAQLVQHILAHGGAGLVIDYGYCQPLFGDTLQALKHHQTVDALAAVGEADLTAHVNFHALHQCAVQAGAATALTTQGAFLRTLGLENRAHALAAASPDKAAAIQSEATRLTHAEQMGQLFKVLGVAHPAYPPLAGFHR